MKTTTQTKRISALHLYQLANDSRLYLFRDNGERDEIPQEIAYVGNGKWCDPTDKYCPELEALSPLECCYIIRDSWFSVSSFSVEDAE